jgi:hypothetical protein
MPSLSAKDRVSLCQFTFSDGRRCRTPRTGKNSHFCFDHAQKEARVRAAESLTKDLAYFFSGDYLSACDLSTALGRLIPAVFRGDVKSRNARTVAYMAQILLQSIQISQHEYINAFGTDNWRDSIRKSVKGNYNHRFPPAPDQPESPQPQPQPAPTPPSTPPQHVQAPVNCHSERSEESTSSSSNSSLATHHSPLPPAPSPHIPLPPTSAEFAQQLLAGLPRSNRPGSTGKTGEGQAPQAAPPPAQSQPPAPATPSNSPQPAAVPHPGIHPDPVGRGEASPVAQTTDKSQHPPATQPAQPAAPTPQPACPEQGRKDNPPPRPSAGPSRDTPWWDSRNLYDPPDSHLL